MATQVLAKGPLSSALGQWLFVGCGALVLFTGEQGVGARELAAAALRLATGRDGLASGAALLREAALHGNNNTALHNGGQQQQQQPIVIHSMANVSNKGWTATLVQLSVGAGACWAAYVVFSTYLPDRVKELLPVTRRFFEVAVTSLGQGVLRVREVLGEQIAALSVQQDAMATKQEETHGEVLGLKDDVGNVQRDVDDIAAAISRCEGALGDAEGQQTYTSRGVGLLVRCVGDLLRANDPAVAAELDRFRRLGSEVLGGGDDGYRDAGGGDGGALHKRRHLECDLSEIGSTASTIIEDQHRQNQHQTATPPPPSGNKGHPSTASPLMGLASPPGTLKIPRSFQGNGRSSGHSSGNATAATAADSGSRSASSSSLYSSPEIEVPRSNGEASDLDGLKGLNVDELLRLVRSGGVGSMRA